MIWLIGCNGLLGREIFTFFKKLNIVFSGTDREIDITEPVSLKKYCENKPVKWIINCAAYTAVDKAEDEIEICKKLNTYGASNVASFAKKIGASIIHISTDYVFDGNGIISGETNTLRPYIEEDLTNPLGIYGISKRDGEIAVLENNPHSFIIRTSWLYGKYGNNFVSTMIRLMNERNEIRVVNDQLGSPTWAFNLSTVILDLIESSEKGKKIPFGIYHYTNEGKISWYEFSEEIYRQAKEMGIINTDCSIVPCTSDEYPSKAKRPKYSVLDKQKIKTVLGITIPAWKNSLRDYLKCIEH